VSLCCRNSRRHPRRRGCRRACVGRRLALLQPDRRIWAAAGSWDSQRFDARSIEAHGAATMALRKPGRACWMRWEPPGRPTSSGSCLSPIFPGHRLKRVARRSCRAAVPIGSALDPVWRSRQERTQAAAPSRKSALTITFSTLSGRCILQGAELHADHQHPACLPGRRGRSHRQLFKAVEGRIAAHETDQACALALGGIPQPLLSSWIIEAWSEESGLRGNSPPIQVADLLGAAGPACASGVTGHRFGQEAAPGGW